MNYELKIEKWSGRLCNNMLQLANAIHVAEKTNSRLSVPENHRGLDVHDFDFSNGEACQTIDPALFFDPVRELSDAAANIPQPLTWNERRNTLREKIRPMLPAEFFPQQPGDPEELVVYIRSGDVFHRAGRIKGRHSRVPDFALWAIRMVTKKGNPVNPFFVQPPLSFYRRVLKSQNWPSMRLVAEDTANPVIPKLLEEFPQLKFAPADLATDIQSVLSAQHLVIGYGTFGITLALLNEHLRTLFTPELTELQLGTIAPGAIDGVDVHAFRFRNYIRHGDWKLSRAQKAVMISHADSDLLEVVQNHENLVSTSYSNA